MLCLNKNERGLFQLTGNFTLFYLRIEEEEEESKGMMELEEE